MFNLHPTLELIVRLLTGDGNAFRSEQVMEISSTWYHLLISKLLYTNPTVKSIDLQYHIRPAMDLFMVAMDQAPTPVDGILQVRDCSLGNAEAVLTVCIFLSFSVSVCP